MAVQELAQFKKTAEVIGETAKQLKKKTSEDLRAMANENAKLKEVQCTQVTGIAGAVIAVVAEAVIGGGCHRWGWRWWGLSLLL